MHRVQGVNAHPRDYLNVFCLGNREPVDPQAPPPPKSAKPGSRQVIRLHTVPQEPFQL